MSLPEPYWLNRILLWRSQLGGIAELAHHHHTEQETPGYTCSSHRYHINMGVALFGLCRIVIQAGWEKDESSCSLQSRQVSLLYLSTLPVPPKTEVHCILEGGGGDVAAVL